MVERVIRTLKEQCVHRHRFETIQHASRAIGDWIRFYNHRRPHQALGMKTPAEAFALCRLISEQVPLGQYTHTATILLDEETGKEFPFGPTCTQYVITDKSLLRGIADFTTRDFTQEEGEGDGGTGGGSGGNAQAARAATREKAMAFAKRYIMLRMDRVANIPGVQSGIQYQPLAKIYAEFQQTRELSDNDINHIINLERAPATPNIYRSDNLLDVYTAYRQLQRRIKETKPGTYRDFLTSVRDSALLRGLKLSSAQIEKAGLKLHPKAFQG